MCLIPKKEHANRVSFITSVSKILAKVLANCLRKVMPSTISEMKKSFLAGRQTVDHALIANEAIENC